MFYDLHMHSCLSPCAEDEMTPNNICNMALIKGLELIAVTDHNSVKNCAAASAAAAEAGLGFIPGIEVTTSEEIHLICLFPDLEKAMAFDAVVKPRILPIKNRPDIFGNQIYMDENDEESGREETLLISATDLDVSGAIALVREHGGVCYPAHVDRPSNGIIAVLGDIPAEYGFGCVEYNDGANEADYRARYPVCAGARTVISSDAHRLWQINEAENSLEIDDEPYSGALVRNNLLFNILK